MKYSGRTLLISLYMWTFICAIFVDSGVRAELVLGGAILGMGLIYVFCWLHFNSAGVENGD